MEPEERLPAADEPRPRGQRRLGEVAAVRRLGLAGIVVLTLIGSLVVAPAATGVWATRMLVASRAGVPWAAQDATSGTAQLATPSIGCLAVDPDGFCTSGAWPGVPGARWIWRTAEVTADEALHGSPWVTFTDSFEWDGAGTPQVVVAADDQFTVRLNGTTVASGGVLPSTTVVTPVVGTNTLTVDVRSLAGSGSPFASPAGVAYLVRVGDDATLSLEASTKDVLYGASVTLTARLHTLSSVRSVSLYGTREGGSEQLLTSDESDADGIVTFTVNPSTTTTYMVRSPGDGVWPSLESAAVRVEVHGVVSLRASRSIVAPGQPVTITVSLSTGAASRRVVLRATTSTSAQRLVASTVLPPGQTWRVVLNPKVTTRYRAAWLGDVGWRGEWSSEVRVGVTLVWTARNAGGYASAGAYRLYHWSARCRPPAYAGCPVRVFTAAPSHRGERVKVEFQRLSRRGWQASSTHLWTLDRHSSVASFSWYTSRVVIGVGARARATFLGDDDHALTVSRWVYWRVTR